MRELTYLIATTLDGFIAREDGSFDFFPATGGHREHIVANHPETIPGHLWDALGVAGEPREFDCVLMGRATYEVGLELGVTSPYPHLEQYVFSGTWRESPDPAVELVSKDALDFVARLKRASGGGIWLCGGARLAGTLLPLVDRLVLKINPVVLGSGIPLFLPRGTVDPIAWRLEGHESFDSGVAIHEYRRAEA